MRMFLKFASLLALMLFLASGALMLVVAGQRQKEPQQGGPTYGWSDLSSLSAEDINRRTLKAAAVLRGK